MKKTLFTATIILLSLIAVSCAKGSTGLFYSLSIEEKIQDNSNLANGVSVANMAQSTSNIFINTSLSIQYRAKTATNWSQIQFPSGMDLCTALTVYNDGSNEYLYAAFSNNDLTVNKLYRVSATSVSSSWAEIYDTGADRITGLFYVFDGSVNHYLFANIQKSTGHSLLYSATPTSAFAGTTAITDSSSPVIGVVYDGTNFWTANSSYLYSDTILANLGTTAVSATELSVIKRFTDIAVSGTNVYVTGIDTTSTGSAGNSYIGLYTGSWQVESYSSSEITSIAISTSPAEIAAGFGLGVKTGSDISSLAAPGGNYLSTNLSSIRIKDLMFVGTDLYTATIGNGLWKRSQAGEWSIE